MVAVMGDYGIILLTYLCDSFDGEVFLFIRGTSWKNLKFLKI